MSTSYQLNAWAIVANRIKQHGIKKVFGMVGDGVGLIEATERVEGVDAITCRDQRSGAAMAMGFCQATQSCTIYSASSGPGLINSLLGILESSSGCLPIVIFSNGVSREAKGTAAFQELDSISLMRPLVKWACRIEVEGKLLWAVDRAIYLAINGKPGPIYIEIPNDLVDMTASMALNLKPLAMERHLVVPHTDLLRQVASVINQNKNIIIITGGGCRFSNCGKLIEQYASCLNAAVFSTASGRNIYPEMKYLACGLIGLYTTFPAEKLFRSCDIFIVLGSQLEETCLIGLKRFLEEKIVVQVDIDYQSINKSVNSDYALIGDIKLTLELLLDFVEKKASHKKWSALISEIQESQKKCLLSNLNEYPVRSLYHLMTNSGLKNKIVVFENGLHDIWGYSFPLFKLMEGDIAITPAEQTGLGLALGQAVGAKFAHPEKEVIAIVGDGAFTMGENALYTAAEEKLKITYIILNSGGFSWPKIEQSNSKVDIGCDFILQKKYKSFAEMIGAIYFNPKTQDEISNAIKMISSDIMNNRIIFIEIKIDTIDIPYNIKKNYLKDKSSYE